MSLSKVKQALSTIDGVSAHLNTYTGVQVDSYITYHEVSQRGLINGDDNEFYTLHTIQVDAYTKFNPDKLASEIKKAMKDIDFTRVNEMSFFNDTTKMTRKMMTFTGMSITNY